jgi:hypothetical protein
MVEELYRRAEELSEEEQMLLAERLRLRALSRRGDAPARRWAEARGVAAPSLLGEDAQQWVSRGRRAADERRG